MVYRAGYEYQLASHHTPPLIQAETAGVIMLATLSSFGCTAAFALHTHNKLLRVPMAEDRDLQLHTERNALMDPKEV